jgi:hypothetical protein
MKRAGKRGGVIKPRTNEVSYAYHKQKLIAEG